MTNGRSNNGFSEYKRLILSELERLDDKLDDVTKKLSKVNTDVAVVKAKLYLMAAGISIVVSALISYLLKIILN